MSDPWLLAAAAVGFIAGGVAAISGFGIGSLLTPLMGVRLDTRLAVAVVALPHAVGTALRFLFLRRQVDRRLLLGFGLTSAAGGLAGALLHAFLGSRFLTAIFGLLLVFAGLSGLTGLARRMRFGGRLAWVAGGLSGFLGGLVGNQGGIPSAALLGFDVQRDAFVATATAVGLIVDAVRLPVYLVTQGSAILAAWPLVLAATAGVVAGTVAGRPILARLPERAFRRIVAVVILALGILMLARL